MDLITFQKQFGTDEACRAYLEAVLWPDSPVCTACGCVDNAHCVRTSKGLWQCNAEGCRSQFTVTRGTIFHGSHLPLPKWFLAMYLIASSSKGISARKVGEWLGVPYSTAWFLCHRIRAMMVDGTPFLLDGIVEINETFAGAGPRKPNRPRDENPQDDDQDSGGSGAPSPARVPVRTRRHGRGTDRPMLLVAVERGRRVHVQPLATHSRDAIETALDGLLAPSALAMTDGLPAYRHLGAERTHRAVNHSRHEYARTDVDTGLRVHVNTAEGFNATMKRAVVGVFHWISRKHLVRYACETSFRWNRRAAEAPERLREMLRLASGRRLPYAALVGAASGAAA